MFHMHLATCVCVCGGVPPSFPFCLISVGVQKSFRYDPTILPQGVIFCCCHCFRGRMSTRTRSARKFRKPTTIGTGMSYFPHLQHWKSLPHTQSYLIVSKSDEPTIFGRCIKHQYTYTFDMKLRLNYTRKRGLLRASTQAKVPWRQKHVASVEAVSKKTWRFRHYYGKNAKICRIEFIIFKFREHTQFNTEIFSYMGRFHRENSRSHQYSTFPTTVFSDYITEGSELVLLSTLYQWTNYYKLALQKRSIIGPALH